jgi:ribosome biogenesis ATPase
LSPADFLSNGKIPPRGFLLHGPPGNYNFNSYSASSFKRSILLSGCGKTQLVYAIAGELNLPLLKITSTELISGVSGESEGNIRDLFDKAISSAPCILFIDEIEAITQRRESASKNMEHRIVTQLLACFDELAVNAYTPIVVIGATNQADSLDIGLRRAGRFDQEIAIGIPDDKHRKQ